MSCLLTLLYFTVLYWLRIRILLSKIMRIQDAEKQHRFPHFFMKQIVLCQFFFPLTAVKAVNHYRFVFCPRLELSVFVKIFEFLGLDPAPLTFNFSRFKACSEHGGGIVRVTRTW
jgi:hypothetical protein